MPHVNPQYRNREAVAPYNFVPLPDKPRLAKEALDHDRFYRNTEDGGQVYSGQFNCELTTETPCYIRGPVSSADFKADKEGKGKSDFFSIDGGKNPRIPGSSLRGLFRELTEIVSSSRIAGVSRHKLVYRAVDTTALGVQYRKRIMDEPTKNFFVPKVKAGYVRQWHGEWYIQPAREINGTTWCRLSHRSMPSGMAPWPPTEIKERFHVANEVQSRNAKTIYVQAGNNEYQEVRGGFLSIKFARAIRASEERGTGLMVAAMAESGKMMSKKSEAVIFEPDPTMLQPEQGWLPLKYDLPNGEEVALDRDYREQISDQQRALLGPNGALQDMQPVFYLVEKAEPHGPQRLIFFGHTFMLRLPYKYAPADHVDSALRAEGQDDIDMAEAIFGYSRIDSNRKNMARSGRLSFSDGAYDGNLPDPFEREIEPKVLSGPKQTTFQHYLQQSMPDDKERLLNYDDQAASIRGYKQYWHRGRISILDAEERDRKKLSHRTQYTSIKAVKTGAKFKFTIRFENLRSEELGALAWILRQAGDEAFRLKLGMGKPHGMGAIKVVSTLYVTDHTARYQSLFDSGGGWNMGITTGKEEISAACTAAFERWAGADPGTLATTPRIAELLTLLRWPGPSSERTRYMEIEHYDSNGRRENEFRTRPVLPAPTFVVTPHFKGTEAPPSRREPEEDSRPSSQRGGYNAPSTARPIVPPPPPPPPKPEPLPEVREIVSKEAKQFSEQMEQNQVSEGAIFEVTVVKINGNDYDCRLATGIKTLGRLPRDEAKGLKVGDKVRAKVKRIAQSGAAMLTTKGVPKGN